MNEPEASDPGQDRQSKPLSKEPFKRLSPLEKAKQEAANTLLQFDYMVGLIKGAINSDKPFRLRANVIQELNRISIDKIEEDAGRWRNYEMEITESQHRPPNWRDVPRLVDEMCDYVNDNWERRDAFHLGAYVMWRLNWIHPFADGNGRTTRAVSYYVLCSRLGFHIPGVPTIPELISRKKGPYYKALESADAALDAGRSDFSQMEELLRNLLAKQMVEALGDSNILAAPREDTSSS